MSKTVSPWAQLTDSLKRAGYYPELALEVVRVALAGQELQAHVVHQETTFDHTSVHRHITVLALTQTRLILAHIDDVGHGEEETSAAATTESIALRKIRSVGLTHGVANPERSTDARHHDEITFAINWDLIRRIEIEPAVCPDPHCETDHGYMGNTMPDDMVLRFSALADGEDAIKQVLDFAGRLSLAVGEI